MAMKSFDELFGPIIDIGEIENPRANSVLRLIKNGERQGYQLETVRCQDDGSETIIVSVHVDRPQRSVHPIKAIESIALFFNKDNQPAVFALRADFPATIPHLNLNHKGYPPSLCIDDRPWSEAKLNWSPTNFLFRIQNWLSKSARGKLHGAVRAPDPVFVKMGPVIILPRSAMLRQEENGLVELFVYSVDSETRRQVIIAKEDGLLQENNFCQWAMLAYVVKPQKMSCLRFPPRSLRELADETLPLGLNLFDKVQELIKKCLDETCLNYRLALVVAFPVEKEGQKTIGIVDIHGFLTSSTIGEIGEELGCLKKDPETGKYGYIIKPLSEEDYERIELLTAEVNFDLDRELASSLSGCENVDDRCVTLVGAGTIGSHVANILAREGRFSWTVIDNDYFLPHNAVRHVLIPDFKGCNKATAFSVYIDSLLNGKSKTKYINVDILKINDPHQEEVLAALSTAEVILDASASVTVGRYLADLRTSHARRLSFFFNPDGTDAVLLVEPEDRSKTLREIEAEYYTIIISNPQMSGHLQMTEERIAYSAACRHMTNQIPESQVSILSALVASEVPKSLADQEGRISVWRFSSDGVQCLRTGITNWHKFSTGEWHIYISHNLLDDVYAKRNTFLPLETGGVLMGVVDMASKSIHIGMAIAAPSDSIMGRDGFERGVFGLKEDVERIITESAGQLSYVGEWHSHPEKVGTKPSLIDINQLTSLANILEDDGIPGIIMIVGQKDTRIIVAGELDETIPHTQIKTVQSAK